MDNHIRIQNGNFTRYLGLLFCFFAMSLSGTAITSADNNLVVEKKYEARALIRASSRIEYRNEIVAPVKTANFLAGEKFEKGELLVELDCSRYEAERNAARASAKAATIELRTKRRLLQYQAVGKNEVELAAAQSAQANAELEVHNVRNQLCVFKAPFSGRVVDLNAKIYEYPPTDKPLIVIINGSKFEMELVVPSNWLLWMDIGTVFTVKVDETGETGLGRIERIAAEVDPVSQTVKVIAGFTQKPKSVLAGMSGTIFFSQETN